MTQRPSYCKIKEQTPPRVCEREGWLHVVTLLIKMYLLIIIRIEKRRKKYMHMRAASLSQHHPNPPPPTLQSPDSSIPLRAWLTAAHSTLTPLSVSILFPPPPRDARDSRCAGRTRAADAHGGTPDHNVITALSRIVIEGTDSSWRCGIDRWGRFSRV